MYQKSDISMQLKNTQTKNHLNWKICSQISTEIDQQKWTDCENCGEIIKFD